MKIKFDVVVTRHLALVEYIREQGLIADNCQVITHATADDVKGKNVLGVLPHRLSCQCATYSEIPLNIPENKRGVELSLDDVRLYAGVLENYNVSIIPNVDELINEWLDASEALDEVSREDFAILRDKISRLQEKIKEISGLEPPYSSGWGGMIGGFSE